MLSISTYLKRRKSREVTIKRRSRRPNISNRSRIFIRTRKQFFIRLNIKQQNQIKNITFSTINDDVVFMVNHGGESIKEELSVFG